MRLEADKLSQAPPGSLGLADRLRQAIVIAPPAMFFYCYLLRGGILDGRQDCSTRCSGRRLK